MIGFGVGDVSWPVHEISGAVDDAYDGIRWVGINESRVSDNGRPSPDRWVRSFVGAEPQPAMGREVDDAVER